MTDAPPSTTPATHYHQAFRASLENPVYNNGTPTIWPDTDLPQMEINQSLLDQDFAPTTSHAPPNSDATDFFPDDPNSAFQRFGPPDLDNWLPNSGATSHYTPVFSDLCDVKSCHVPVPLADGTTKISTFKGTTDCYFTTTEGQKSILGLVDVYYIEGLSHGLLSLTAISATQNFTIIIQNSATTIRVPKNATYAWATILNELPSQQAFSMISQPKTTLDDDTSASPAISFEQHLDTSTTPDSTQPMATLQLEITSQRLAHRNFRSLITGSLHNVWNDHIQSPATDTNTWHIRISISQKRAHSKVSLCQGTEPFHQLHLDLLRNLFCFGLTTSTSFSTYLFIVTTPGKFTGWIGLPTESTASILTALVIQAHII